MSIVANKEEIVNYLNSITTDADYRLEVPSTVSYVGLFDQCLRAVAVRNEHKKTWHMMPDAEVETDDGLVGLFPVTNVNIAIQSVNKNRYQSLVDALELYYECSQFPTASNEIIGQLVKTNDTGKVYDLNSLKPKAVAAPVLKQEPPQEQEPEPVLVERPSIHSSHPEVVEAALEEALEKKLGQGMVNLPKSDKGEEKAIYVLRLLEHYFGDELVYDELKQVLRYRGVSVTEDDLRQIAFNMLCETREAFSLELFTTYAYLFGRKRTTNSFKEFLGSLKPCKTPDKVFSDLFSLLGFTLPLEQDVFKRFMVGIIARTFSPGCPMDWLPIFQGAQGIGKSLLLRVLMCSDRDLTKEGKLPFLDLFLDHEVQSQDKDTLAAMVKFVLVEMSEYDDWQKKMTSGGMKRFISRSTDVYRKPYDREQSEHPRSQVLSATVNPAEFLNDPTGSRRMFVYRLKTPKGKRWFDKRELAKLVPDLWSAALAMYQEAQASPCPENAWLLSDIQDEVEAHNLVNLAEHPLDALIDNFLDKQKGEPFTKDSILISLGMDNTHSNSGESKIVGNKLHELGYEKEKMRWNGRNANFYYHPEMFDKVNKVVIAARVEEDEII